MGQMAQNLGNSNIMDPRQAKWGDLDASEKGARMIGGATRGLGAGLQAYGNQIPQTGREPQIIPMQSAQQPQVQLPGMMPKGNNLNFYDGY